ncbi:MAG: WYL domain-containing protein [Cytophagaceae bacterium]|nr:WYL domain-containing protein [Cytophagaceae bacterium]
MKTILDAVLNKNLIKIEYLTNAFLQVNTRTIEPVGIYAQGNYWYLVAFVS